MAAIAPQACFVINLDRRPERLEAFCRRYPREMPAPERFAAVDGQELAPAGEQYRGRWGCWESHRAAYQLCDEQRVEAAAFFEDDAWPVPDAGRLWGDVLDALPGDWQMVWLGGKHYGGRRVNRYVGAVRAAVVLHAYMVRQPLLGELARELADHRPDTHVDNRIAELIAGRPGLYGSIPWLFYPQPFTWPDIGETSGANWVPRPQPCDLGPDGRCRRDRCRQIGAPRCAVSPGLMHVDEEIRR